MPCVTASNSAEILRTNSSYSRVEAENRRMDHHQKNATKIRRLPSECKCSMIERMIKSTKSRRILRFRHTALLVLFVLINIYAIVSAAPRVGYGRYCGKALADAYMRVCRKHPRATQRVRETSRRTTRASVSIVQMCCMTPCHVAQLEPFCEERHLLRVIGQIPTRIPRRNHSQHRDLGRNTASLRTTSPTGN